MWLLINIIQGEACLLGVNDFTLLLDGGFQRRTCFWDFVRHVDRLDAIVATSVRAGASSGVRAMLHRLALANNNPASPPHPTVAYCFANEPAKQPVSVAVNPPKNALLVPPFEAAHG